MVTFEEILEKVIRIAEAHFSDYDQSITAETVSADIPAWNSLQHVMLMAKIEERLGIKFDLLQMIDMKSIEDISKKALELLESR